MKNKPLSSCIKENPAVLKKALEEMHRIQQEKRLREEAKTDPKKKLLLLMLKAKHMKLKQNEEKEAADKALAE